MRQAAEYQTLEEDYRHKHLMMQEAHEFQIHECIRRHFHTRAATVTGGGDGTVNFAMAAAAAAAAAANAAASVASTASVTSSGAATSGASGTRLRPYQGSSSSFQMYDNSQNQVQQQDQDQPLNLAASSHHFRPIEVAASNDPATPTPLQAAAAASNSGPIASTSVSSASASSPFSSMCHLLRTPLTLGNAGSSVSPAVSDSDCSGCSFAVRHKLHVRLFLFLWLNQSNF